MNPEIKILLYSMYLTMNHKLLLSTTIIGTFFLFTGILSGEGYPGFQWPIVRGNYPNLYGITSTFGESRKDHFHTGLDISGLKIPVNPLQSGRIIFSRTAEDSPYQPLPGAGNYVILDHGNGWWSGYYHLESLSENRSGMVSLEDTIGLSGNTGHSYGAHLHFFITSDNGRSYVNPLKLLPPVTDLNPPVIGALVIRTPDSITHIQHSRTEDIRLTQAYPFQVIINDPGMEKYTRRGIYRIQWRLNGGNLSSMTFDRIGYSKEGWKLNEKSLYDDVFDTDLYNLGPMALDNGINTIELSATDFAGNTTEVEYTINVSREF